MTIQEDFSSIVDKHLPAEIGQQLNRRLNEIESLEEELDAERGRINQLRDQLEKAGDVKKRLEEVAKREEEVAKRESYCDERERELDISSQVNHVRSECEQLRREDAQAVLDKLLGNRVLRERIQGQILADGGEHTESYYNNEGEQRRTLSSGQVLKDTEGSKETEEG